MAFMKAALGVRFLAGAADLAEAALFDTGLGLNGDAAAFLAVTGLAVFLDAVFFAVAMVVSPLDR